MTIYFKNDTYSHNNASGAGNVGTYHTNDAKDCPEILEIMKKEGEKFGRIIESNDGFFIQLPSDVVIDCYSTSYTNILGKNVGLVNAVAKNTNILPGQDVQMLAKMIYSPFIEKKANNRDCASVHADFISETDIKSDMSNFSFRIMEKGEKQAKLMTYFDANAKYEQLLPEEILQRIERMNLYGQPRKAFELSLQNSKNQDEMER